MHAASTEPRPAWPGADALARAVPLPAGYRCRVPGRADVPALVQAVDDWFPGLAVGNASCFLREPFYAQRVQLADRPAGPPADFFVLLFEHATGWAGLLAVERDPDSQVLYGRVGTVGPAHRGAGLSRCFPALMEAMGRSMGLGMVYSLATLKVPHMQRGFERAGWQLAGVMPGFDREVAECGRVRRVFEAIYVKVLADASELLRPPDDGMTPATRALFRQLQAPGADAARGSRPG